MASPLYNVYATADDKIILIAPMEKHFWISFCQTIERDIWIGRVVFENVIDMGAGDPDLRQDIQTGLATRTAADWIRRFTDNGVPVSPVIEVPDLENDDHTKARGMVVGTDDARYPNARFVSLPIKIPEADYRVAIPPPQLGEHTTEVLTSLGYTDEAEADLKGNGITREMVADR